MSAIRVVRIPMRLRFRRTGHRLAALLRGAAGWGEFSPFPEYGPAYAARWLAAARDAAERDFPPAVRGVVPVNATVPAVAPDRAADLVRAAGCTTVKVKVAEPGQDLADDVDRVAAVRDVLGPAGRVRVDANGAWDVASAVLALTRLGRYDLEYAEQPVATLEELADLRRRVDVPLAADESIRTATDPMRVKARGAADIVVLKVQPLGGVWRALDIAAEVGLPVVVSSALETSVGLSAGLALAAALPDLPYACGLGTALLLRGDVVTDSLVPVDGALRVRRPDPDPALLDTWAASAPEAAEMLDRMAAAEDAAGRFV